MGDCCGLGGGSRNPHAMMSLDEGVLSTGVCRAAAAAERASCSQSLVKVMVNTLAVINYRMCATILIH